MNLLWGVLVLAFVVVWFLLAWGFLDIFCG